MPSIPGNLCGLPRFSGWHNVDSGIASTPCVSDGLVFVGSADGNLYCLRTTDGGIEWQAQTLDRDEQPARSWLLPWSTTAWSMSATKRRSSTHSRPTPTAALCGNNRSSSTSRTRWTPKITRPTRTGPASRRRRSRPQAAQTTWCSAVTTGTCIGSTSRTRMSQGPTTGWILGDASSLRCRSGVGTLCFVGATRYRLPNFFRIPWDAEQGRFGAPEGPEGIELEVHECRATAALRPGVGEPLTPDAAFVGVDTGWTFHKVELGQPLAEPVTAFEATEGVVLNYFVGSAAVTSGGLVFVGNDNHRLYVLDAEVSRSGQVEEDAPPRNLEGVVCSSPALSTNVDGTGQLWLFVTSRYNGGTFWAFTVHEETE